MKNNSNNNDKNDVDDDDDTIVDVLIIGAGPVGLTAANEAKRLGLSVRIVERKSSSRSCNTGIVDKDSRALVIHPRVLELLEPIMDDTSSSIVQSILDDSDLSFPATLLNLRFSSAVHEKPLVANFSTDAHWGDTDFPFITWIPQYETIRVLEQALERTTTGGAGAGAERVVEFSKSLESLQQEKDFVTVTVTSMDTTSNDTNNEILETIKARYVLGADGGRSKTRDLIGVEMNRHQEGIYMAAADIQFATVGGDNDNNKQEEQEQPLTTTKTTNNPLPLASFQGHVFLSPQGTIGMPPLPYRNAFRVFFIVPPETRAQDINQKYLQRIFSERLGLTDEIVASISVQWKGVFEITHGISDSLQSGRVFLAGDAAHVHSPVGGQGMNFGMQDAMNVMWKLKWAERVQRLNNTSGSSSSSSSSSSDNKDKDDKVDRLTEMILRSYESERHGLGSELVKNVNIATNIVMTTNPVLLWIRNCIIRLAFSYVIKDALRVVGQLDDRYQPAWSNLLFETDDTDTSPSFLQRMLSFFFFFFWTRTKPNKFVTSAGCRLPNLRLLVVDGTSTRLHSRITNRSRHILVFCSMEIPKSFSQRYPSIATISVTPNPCKEEQTSIPALTNRQLTQPQVILVRPTLYVAGVAESYEKLLQAMQKKLGPDLMDLVMETL